jgi:hypothetical protein
MQNKIPDRCRCGSKRLRRIPKSEIRTMPYAGTLPDGFEYSAIQWERKQCFECGQVLAVKTYLP